MRAFPYVDGESGGTCAAGDGSAVCAAGALVALISTLMPDSWSEFPAPNVAVEFSAELAEDAAIAQRSKGGQP